MRVSERRGGGGANNLPPYRQARRQVGRCHRRCKDAHIIRHFDAAHIMPEERIPRFRILMEPLKAVTQFAVSCTTPLSHVAALSHLAMRGKLWISVPAAMLDGFWFLPM